MTLSAGVRDRLEREIGHGWYGVADLAEQVDAAIAAEIRDSPIYQAYGRSFLRHLRELLAATPGAVVADVLLDTIDRSFGGNPIVTDVLVPLILVDLFGPSASGASVHRFTVPDDYRNGAPSRSSRH